MDHCVETSNQEHLRLGHQDKERREDELECNLGRTPLGVGDGYDKGAIE